MLTAIVGINWGDEGKGRMVDLLSADYDVVVRYQGGSNAGHTVVNDLGEFVLNLLPCGVFRKNTVNVMGNGMAVDIEHLDGEIKNLLAKGVEIGPQNLRISDKAIICMPYHRQLDCLEEDRLADAKFGSTRRGIAPVYADKYMKKDLRMYDLLHPEDMAERLRGIVEWKNLTIEKGYGATPVSYNQMLAWLHEFGDSLKPYICDAGEYLDRAAAAGRSIMFEAQLGTLRDVDFGIYPYTTSSNTIAAYAPIGAGIPARRLDSIVGIMKAYSSCVGEGPFACELFGEEGDALRQAGHEYGAATGRPRRVGGFDAVASRYGVHMQGADCLALTKLDVLSYMDKIPVCTAYDVDGICTFSFPQGGELVRAKPVYEYLPGFKCDISGCRTAESLPKEAMDYIKYIENAVGCPIKYVSVGAGRDEYIVL